MTVPSFATPYRYPLILWAFADYRRSVLRDREVWRQCLPHRPMPESARNGWGIADGGLSAAAAVLQFNDDAISKGAVAVGFS